MDKRAKSPTTSTIPVPVNKVTNQGFDLTATQTPI